MAQTSLPWANNGIGDGQSYDDDEWSDWQRKAFTADRTLQGPIFGYLNELLVANPSGYTLRIPTGAAWVDGKFYENSADLDFTTTDDGTAIGAPGLGTNYYTVVLRKDWAAQTVRAAVLNVSTVAYPTVTQTDGTTWEIALAHLSVTSGGVKTLTDIRYFANCDGAPRLASRQGGSATDWTSAGVTAYYPKTDVIVQCGAITCAPAGNVTVTFPRAFSQPPIIMATPAIGGYMAGAASVSATDVSLFCAKHDGTTASQVIYWLAIGPA